MGKEKNKLKGNFAENIASRYLELFGYRIIERNFNCSFGEVDIIAIDKNELVFIEVKARFQNTYGEPAEAVDFNKRSRIYNVANYYLYLKNLSDSAVRFDVLEVFISNNKKYKFRLIKNAIFDCPKIFRR